MGGRIRVTGYNLRLRAESRPVYAIIEDSGTQIKVAPGDVVDVDLREVGPRTKKIKFDRVLLLGGDANGDAAIGAPYVDGAAVTASFDGDDVGRIVLQQPAAAEFIARKLVRWFVADEPLASDRLIRPLAEQFRRHDLQIEPLVRMILSSNLFFSKHAVARKVRSPIDLAVGLLRGLQATTNTSASSQQKRSARCSLAVISAYFRSRCSLCFSRSGSER